MIEWVTHAHLGGFIQNFRQPLFPKPVGFLKQDNSNSILTLNLKAFFFKVHLIFEGTTLYQFSKYNSARLLDIKTEVRA